MATESFMSLDANERVIIAMKGLPCTSKTLVAEQIGNWADRPVLYIDDFIGPLDNNNIADESWKEAERLQLSVLQQAFTTLCQVANRHLSAKFKCVVIKSRLSSQFELKHLIQLVAKTYGCKLLIVECQVRNKHQWQNRFNEEGNEKRWYRPRRWNDIIDMKARRDDHFDPQSLAPHDWDLHLKHLVQQHRRKSSPFFVLMRRIKSERLLVRRLVVDPYYDLDLPVSRWSINPIFAHAINHLLRAEPEELNHQNPYVVEFDEFRRSRAKEILNALTTSSTRSKDVCGLDGCLFKYKEELRVDEDDDVDGESSCCGVCEQKLVSGKPGGGGGYSCHYCILTLHKPCAELIHLFDPLSITFNYCFDFDYYIGLRLPASQEKHACNSHLQEFKGYCDFCCFQTALKGRILPAVVNHDHHPHPLSLRIRGRHFICKACGVGGYDRSSYGCRICEWYYHIQCVHMPGEWKHKHGGHEHVLKRKYSHEDKEQEDYWCDVCFEDLDPYYWYYSCGSCPYYAAHLYCVGFHPRPLWFPWED